MADTSKIAYLLERLAQGVAAHDRENPGHHTWGIGMAGFDIDRLGLEEGEEILRVLCDGQHGEGAEEEEEEVLDAVASEELAEPVSSPGPGAPPPLQPPL